MNNHFRRYAPNRSARQEVRYETTVVNATALSRSVSLSKMDRALGTTVQPKDSISQDPFVSISRAIHTAKLRAGAHLRTMTVTKNSRPRLGFGKDLAKRSYCFPLTIIIAIGLITVLLSSHILRYANTAFSGKARYSDGNQADSVSMRDALRHRPVAPRTHGFAAGPWLIAIVADLDKESCRLHELDRPLRPVPCGKANSWVSYFKRGVLDIPAVRGGRGPPTVQWLDEVQLENRMHFGPEGGNRGEHVKRAMELSELEWFNGHLLTPDDHTGSLLEIVSPRGDLNETIADTFYESRSEVTPTTFHRAALHDGPGTNKQSAFKSEWMAVYGENLFIGGHGRPYTDAEDGTIVTSTNPLWIKVVDKDFKVMHANWTTQYQAVAAAADADFPGYLMHEAVLWSSERSEWVFLPRRRSKEPFNPGGNERKGWSNIIISNEDFSVVESLEILGLQDESRLRGFSAAKFVPGTRDRMIFALRTTEEDPTALSPTRKTGTYMSIFEIPSGKMIYGEERISNRKYEGLVFL